MSRFDAIADRHADPALYRPKRIYNRIVKRIFDFLIAAVLLLVSAPVMLIIAVCIKSDTSGSVFYRGLRTGYRGRPFRIFKFRSMVNNAEKLGGGTTAHNDSRVTRVGRFLRKTKLDEIPQLINIIMGDMSFIGPRPELPRYTDMYRDEERIILDVRPGITDISSIRYIYLEELVGELDVDEKYEKDILSKKNALRVQYVLRQSIFLDTWLLFETIRRVIKKAILYLTRTVKRENAGKRRAEEI